MSEAVERLDAWFNKEVEYGNASDALISDVGEVLAELDRLRNENNQLIMNLDIERTLNQTMNKFFTQWKKADENENKKTDA